MSRAAESVRQLLKPPLMRLGWLVPLDSHAHLAARSGSSRRALAMHKNTTRRCRRRRARDCLPREDLPITARRAADLCGRLDMTAPLMTYADLIICGAYEDRCLRLGRRVLRPRIHG